MNTISQAVGATTYPGRGIVLGKSADGKKAVIVYFIMGRSANSRNRVFLNEGKGIRTEAYDPFRLEDPSLIIYSPMRVFEKNLTIVTNGDQTDTVYEALDNAAESESMSVVRAYEVFSEALSTREFEPDAPNYTPRISGMVYTGENDMSYCLSILKSADGDPSECLHFTFRYPCPIAGTAHFIHTYQCDGSPIPSFAGEPEKVSIGNNAEEIIDEVWKALNADNKVSLFVRTIDLENGETETVIRNKNVEEK